MFQTIDTDQAYDLLSRGDRVAAAYLFCRAPIIHKSAVKVGSDAYAMKQQACSRQ